MTDEPKFLKSIEGITSVEENNASGIMTVLSDGMRYAFIRIGPDSIVLGALMAEEVPEEVLERFEAVRSAVYPDWPEFGYEGHGYAVMTRYAL